MGFSKQGTAHFFYDDLNFWGTNKNNCRFPHEQQEIFFKIEPCYLLRKMIR